MCDVPCHLFWINPTVDDDGVALRRDEAERIDAGGAIGADAEFGAWRCQYQPCDYDNPCGFREVCETLSGVAVATCQTRGVCDGGEAGGKGGER